MKFYRLWKNLIVILSTVLFFCGALAVVLSITPVSAEGTRILKINAEEISLNDESVAMFEVIKTVGKAKTSERLAITQTKYTLPSFTTQNGQIALGWLYNGELYKIGENITIDKNNREILLEAITLEYTLADGASIRYGEEDASGIRFLAELREENSEKAQPFLRELGVLVLPSDKLREGVEFTYENYGEERECNLKQVDILNGEIYFDKSGVFQLYNTLSNINVRKFNQNYCARAYVKVLYKSGEVCVYTDNIKTRSVYQVASNILQANPTVMLESWEESLLNGYVNSVVNISYDKDTNMAQNICASSNPVIKGVQVRIETNGTVTLILKTTIRSFFAFTFNGQRILYTGQVYDSENGLLTVKFSVEDLTE